MNSQNRSIWLRVIVGLATVAAGNLLAVVRSNTDPSLGSLAVLILAGGYALIFLPHLPIRTNIREPRKQPRSFPGIPTVLLIILFIVMVGANYWFIVWSDRLHEIRHY